MHEHIKTIRKAMDSLSSDHLRQMIKENVEETVFLRELLRKALAREKDAKNLQAGDGDSGGK